MKSLVKINLLIGFEDGLIGIRRRGVLVLAEGKRDREQDYKWEKKGFNLAPKMKG